MAQSGLVEYGPSFVVKWNLPENYTYPSYVQTFYSEKHDVVLLCGKKSVKTYKKVLVDCSEYFKKMLAEPVQHEEKRPLTEPNQSLEKRPETKPLEIDASFLSYSALNVAVNFMQNGETNIPQSLLGCFGEALIILSIKPPEIPNSSRIEFSLAVSYFEWEKFMDVTVHHEDYLIILHCDKESVCAHKDVVCAGSKIFAKKIEEAGDTCIYEIEGIPFDILKMILDLWYKRTTIISKPSQLILLYKALFLKDIRALKVITQGKPLNPQETTADVHRLKNFLRRAVPSANTIVKKLFQAGFSLRFVAESFEEEKEHIGARMEARAKAMEKALTTLSSSVKTAAENLQKGIRSSESQENADKLLTNLLDVAKHIQGIIKDLRDAIVSGNVEENITSEQSEGSSEAGTSIEEIKPVVELAENDALAILTALVQAGRYTEVEIRALAHELVECGTPTEDLPPDMSNVIENMKQIVSQYEPSKIRENIYPDTKE